MRTANKLEYEVVTTWLTGTRVSSEYDIREDAEKWFRKIRSNPAVKKVELRVWRSTFEVLEIAEPLSGKE